MEYINLIAFFTGTGPFGEFGLSRLNDYSWPISQTLRDAFHGIPVGDGYDANITLRQHLHQRWLEAGAGERRELAQTVVSGWGGVHGNGQEVLARHAATASAASTRDNFDIAGIASLSKVLCIAGPQSFAIYDARVSVALAAVNLLAGNGEGLYFPYVPSRRPDVQSFQRVNALRALRRQYPNATFFNRTDAYRNYCQALVRISQKLGFTIQDLEMCLFAQAIDLIEKGGALAQ